MSHSSVYDGDENVQTSLVLYTIRVHNGEWKDKPVYSIDAVV